MTQSRLPALRLTVLCFLALPAAVGELQAQGASSIFTEFNLDRCAVVEKLPETGSVVQRCNGLDDFPLFIAEDDLRFFVGYGPNGRRQKAFTQTLPQFNSIHSKIEFRMRPGSKHPYASILRYFTDSGDGRPKGQVLVVTKIAGKEACHMAYIDAIANKDANQLAQRTADEMASTFDCARDEPRDIGAVGPGRS
jgi:hypothetical protein